jgi:hypothetical protein
MTNHCPLITIRCPNFYYVFQGSGFRSHLNSSEPRSNQSGPRVSAAFLSQHSHPVIKSDQSVSSGPAPAPPSFRRLSTLSSDKYYFRISDNNIPRSTIPTPHSTARQESRTPIDAPLVLKAAFIYLCSNRRKCKHSQPAQCRIEQPTKISTCL